MKRNILCVIYLAALLALLTLSANAQSTGTLTVKDSDNQTVKTFTVTVDRPDLDSTKDIQKALDFARDNATAEKPMTVVFPKGEYGIFSTLNLYGNTTLDLSDSILYRSEKGGSIIRFGRGSDKNYGYNGYQNITVKNGTLDAGQKGKNSLMRFAHASNIKILSMTFKNTKDVMHLLTFAASKDVLIDNCTFSDMTLSSASTSNCEAVQIDILNEHHFGDNVYDGTKTRNVTVSNCTFENLIRGVGTHSAIIGHYFDNIKIINNTFRNIIGYAVNALNYRNSKISGNTISSCGSGIDCSHISNAGFGNMYAPLKEDDKADLNAHVTISDNKISIKDKGFLHIAYGISIAGAVAKNVKDKDGKVYSADLRISDITVENNTITTSVKSKNSYAIDISGAVGSSYNDKSNVRILNNKIIFSGKEKSKKYSVGIRLLDNKNIYLYKNSCTCAKGAEYNYDSSVLASRCSNIYFKANSFSYPASFGMKITGCSGLTLQESTLKKCKNNAVYVMSGSKKIKLQSNKIYDCSAYAICVRDSHASYISKNSIYNCANHAIYLTGTGKCGSVSSNYISLPKGQGIYLNDNAYAGKIISNRIRLSNASRNAIGINGSASAEIISKNIINEKSKKDKVKLTCLNGIYINAPKAELKQINENKIYTCAKSGISIVKAKSKPEISGNTVSGCQNGISYAKGRLSKNNITKYSGSKTVKV